MIVMKGSNKLQRNSDDCVLGTADACTARMLAAAYRGKVRLVIVRCWRIQAVSKRHIVDHVSWWILIIQKLLNQDADV